MTKQRSSYDHSAVTKTLVQYGGNILYVVTITEIYAEQRKHDVAMVHQGIP